MAVGGGGAGWVGCKGGILSSSSSDGTASRTEGGLGRKRGGGGSGGVQDTRPVKATAAMMGAKFGMGVGGILKNVSVSMGSCNQMLRKNGELADFRDMIAFFENMETVGLHSTEQ